MIFLIPDICLCQLLLWSYITPTALQYYTVSRFPESRPLRQGMLSGGSMWAASSFCAAEQQTGACAQQKKNYNEILTSKPSPLYLFVIY